MENMKEKTILKSRRLKRKSEEDFITDASQDGNSQKYDGARLSLKMRKYSPPTDSEHCEEENVAQVNMKENSLVPSGQSSKYLLTKARRRTKDKKKPLVPPLGSLNENIEFADCATGFTLSPQAEKPYKCHLCVKQFKYFSNLKSHMNIVHKKMIEQSHIDGKSTVTNGQVFQCEICFRNFKYFSNLRTHRLVHTSSELEANESI